MEHDKLVHDGEMAIMNVQEKITAEQRLKHELAIEDRWLAEKKG